MSSSNTKNPDGGSGGKDKKPKAAKAEVSSGDPVQSLGSKIAMIGKLKSKWVNFLFIYSSSKKDVMAVVAQDGAKLCIVTNWTVG